MSTVRSIISTEYNWAEGNKAETEALAAKLLEDDNFTCTNVLERKQGVRHFLCAGSLSLMLDRNKSQAGGVL